MELKQGDDLNILRIILLIYGNAMNRKKDDHGRNVYHGKWTKQFPQNDVWYEWYAMNKYQKLFYHSISSRRIHNKILLVLEWTDSNNNNTNNAI